jgi:hypothetical protein
VSPLCTTAIILPFLAFTSCTFETIFSYSKLKNFEITTDINIANILLESGKPPAQLREIKNWKYKMNFIGEPVLPDSENYDIVFTSVNNMKNILDLPLCVMYIHCNHFLPRLLYPIKVIKPATDFCTFIVSNPNCGTRNKIFERLNQYKKVSSLGRHTNNMGYIIGFPYWSDDYFQVLGQHKFMICCENTKMTTYSTEKIVNPYLGRTIPIYWGTHNIKNLFNPESMLFLEDETEEAMENLINKIIELDNDDEKYLEFVNRPIFNEHNIQFWKDNYNLDSIGRKIDEILCL